jgi:hypothetical protein
VWRRERAPEEVTEGGILAAAAAAAAGGGREGGASLPDTVTARVLSWPPIGVVRAAYAGTVRVRATLEGGGWTVRGAGCGLCDINLRVRTCGYTFRRRRRRRRRDGCGRE